MYFALESTKCDKKNIVTYSYHMTSANCASDPISNNVNGNVSIDVTGTRSVCAGECCVRLQSVENKMKSEYYTLLSGTGD